MAKKGEPLSAEFKQELSRLAKERYRRNLESQVGEPERKRCAKCERWLLIDGNFYVRKIKIRSGIVERAESWCKKCVSQIQKDRYLRQKAEGVDFRARQKRYEAKEDPRQRRKRRNEREAVRRRKAGMKVRKPFTQPMGGGEKLDLRPIVSLLENELPALAQKRNDFNKPNGISGDGSTGVGILAERSGVHQRRIYGLLHGEYKHVSLSVVDRLLCGLGLPHMLPILYPEEP